MIENIPMNETDSLMWCKRIIFSRSNETDITLGHWMIESHLSQYSICAFIMIYMHLPSSCRRLWSALGWVLSQAPDPSRVSSIVFAPPLSLPAILVNSLRPTIGHKYQWLCPDLKVLVAGDGEAVCHVGHHQVTPLHGEPKAGPRHPLDQVNNLALREILTF